jgi:predicted dinucleotide-binding enzyme
MTRLGFVGLGQMGGNMAARFLAAGYTVHGESRDRRHAQNLVHDGLRWRDTPREVAQTADVLLMSLPCLCSPPITPAGLRASPRRRHRAQPRRMHLRHGPHAADREPRTEKG